MAYRRVPDSDIRTAKAWLKKNPDGTYADYRREVKRPMEQRSYNKYVLPDKPRRGRRPSAQIYQTVAVLDGTEKLEEIVEKINNAYQIKLELVQLSNGTSELRRTQKRG